MLDIDNSLSRDDAAFLSTTLASVAALGVGEIKHGFGNVNYEYTNPDDDGFHVDSPAPGALRLAVDFQKVGGSLRPGGLLVVGHCGGVVGLDFMLQPHLHLLRATEIHRTDFAVWRLPSTPPPPPPLVGADGPNAPAS